MGWHADRVVYGKAESDLDRRAERELDGKADGVVVGKLRES